MGPVVKLILLLSVSVSVVVMADDMEQEDDMGILKSLRQYENLRRNAKNVSRVHNLDIVDTGTSVVPATICHMVEMNRYSTFDRKGSRVLFDGYPVESLAAVALALEHLNTGDGSVIPEVEGLDKRCPIRFTSEFLDTQGQESAAVDRVIDTTQRDLSTTGPAQPCAFVGAWRSVVSVATSIVTGLRGYPQFSALSMTSQLNDKDTFPLFGRVVPSHDVYAIPFLDYIYHTLGIRHLAIIHTDNTVGISYNSGIVATAGKDYPDLVLRSVAYPAVSKTKEDFRPSVQVLKDSGFRFFFAIVRGTDFLPMIEQALDEGIAGTGVHNWMVSNGAVPGFIFTQQEWPEDSPLLKVGQGLMTYQIQGSTPGTGRYDEFAEALSNFADSPQDLEYLQSKLPTYPDEPTYVPKVDADVFRGPPHRFFHFVPLKYDATILLGLAACDAAAAASDDAALFDGTEHYQTALNTTFVGGSGQILLDQDTGTRIPTSAVFIVTNVVSRPANGKNFSLVEERVGTYFTGEWNDLRPVVLNDNTTGPILDLPPAQVDYNYIGTGLRAAGLTIAGIIVVLSFLFGFWTQFYRAKRVVKAAQPFFLLQICFGTFLMGCSIIPLSIDDEIASDQGNDIACMATPWLLSMGWVFSFSALVAKTSRVNKVFHNPSFHRVKVTILDVVKPMAVLLLVNALILALWTGLSPLEWSRDAVDVDRFDRTSESQGSCWSDGSLPYLISLLVVDLGVLVVACYQAYVARNIATEFAESESIAKAIVCILLVASLGIPVLYIAEQNQRAFYFVFVGNIFVICVSLLCLIFIPKVIYQRRNIKRNVTALVRQTLASTSNNTRQADDGPKSTYSSGVDGIEVLEHPKVREDLKQRVTVLEKRVVELESIFEDDCVDESTLRARYQGVRSRMASGSEASRSNVVSRATANTAASVAEGVESNVFAGSMTEGVESDELREARQHDA